MQHLKTLMRRKKQTTETTAAAASTVHEKDGGDGWVFLTADKEEHPKPGQRKPSSDEAPFDQTGDDIVRVYLPCRRSLNFHGLPPWIHDADIYTVHPAFLTSVYPAANDGLKWFFFVCRSRGAGGRRRAGPGAYRLTGESTLAGNGYRHTFRYCEDAADTAAAKETEWRMDEYGIYSSGSSSGGIKIVVCKVHPAPGGALHKKLASDRTARCADVDLQPQVLVQFYFASFSLGDPLRCRIYPADDFYGAHPAVLTTTYPVANDRFEWFFFVWREHDDGDKRPRKAGPGAYVVVRTWSVVDGLKRDIGYRNLFQYREDDATERRFARAVWWMEEFGFGPEFPFGELPAAKVRDGEWELVVCKVYQTAVDGDHRR